MSNNFRVGQKVVCVDASGQCIEPMCNETDVYTVSRVFLSPISKTPLIDLVELPRPLGMHDGVGFLAARFRPLVDRKTDISIFTKMLTDTPVKITERA
jgi:hypothetical protein